MSYGLPLVLRDRPPAARERGIPWRIQDSPKRIATWEYCREIRQRWDEWEEDMVRAGLIEDTRQR